MSSTRKVLEANADPDYENLQDKHFGEVSESLQREDTRDHTVQKIQEIVHNQFSFEIHLKEKEVLTINRRVQECRASLDRLRACILAGYYGYGTLPAQQPAVVKTGKARTTKTCLEETSLHNIMNWKRSLPSSLKEQPPDENLSSRNRTNEGTNEGTNETNCAPSMSGTINSLGSDKPDLSTQVNENESRFYIKRRIIIGNTSKYLLPEQREKNDRSTHKWMVYVRGPKDDGPDSGLHNFISKVWFLLHPSYQPNDLVEVCKPPFQVTRRGWGEFPVRVQLHFVESKNKRVDIIHHLRLDKTYTGLQTLGAETHVDIELDRKNFDGLGKPGVEDKSRKTTTPCSQDETTTPVSAKCFDLPCGPSFGMETDGQKKLKMDIHGKERGMLSDHSYSTTEKKSSCQDDLKYPTPQTSVPGSRISTPRVSGKLPESASADVEQDLEKLLQKSVQQFPVVRPEESVNKPGYCAGSLEQFLAWNVGKRLATEWQRALDLKLHLNKEERVELSTKRVMNYCRLHGYTPMVDVPLDGKPLCKLCGEEVDSDEGEGDDDDDDDDGDDDGDDDDDKNEESMMAHEECVSDFDEEDILETDTTAQEFLELLSRPENTLGKHDEKLADVGDIDVVGVTHEQVEKDSSVPRLFFLPVTEQHVWVQKIAAEVDVLLTNCDIDGVHAPVSSAMLYKACRLFVEDIVRKANRFTWRSTSSIPKAKCILPVHVKKALEVIPHCDFLTDKYLKVEVDKPED